MKKTLFVALALLFTHLAHAQIGGTTGYFPLAIDGNMEDRTEVCSDPQGDIYYFAPFKQNHIDTKNEAAGLLTFSSGASSTLNGLIQKRNTTGITAWSSELVPKGDIRYSISDPYTTGWFPTTDWEVPIKVYDIAYDPINELVVVTVSVSNVMQPVFFGANQLVSPGIHFFFFDPGSGTPISVHQASNISDEAFPKDLKVGNNNGFLYLAHQNHGACSGVAVYDLQDINSGGAPIFIDNHCINHTSPAGDIGIREISLDPFDVDHEWVYVGGTFSNGTITANLGSATAGTDAASYMLSLQVGSGSPWEWVHQVQTPQGPAKTIGVAPHLPTIAGQEGMPILAGYTESSVINFSSGPAGLTGVSHNSFVLALDKATGTPIWEESVDAYQATALAANAYSSSTLTDRFILTGIPRENSANPSLYAGLFTAENYGTRHTAAYDIITSPASISRRWESHDDFPATSDLYRTDVEFNGDYCFEYGRYYPNPGGIYVLQGGADTMPYVGAVPQDAFIMRIEANATGTPTISRLAGDAPTAANNQGDYEQTGNGLPGLGQAVETQNFASLLQTYPNPVTQRAVLQIQAQGTAAHNLRISNVAGQVIWQRALLPAQDNMTLNVADWPSGLYVLSYEDALGQPQQMKIQVVR